MLTFELSLPKFELLHGIKALRIVRGLNPGFRLFLSISCAKMALLHILRIALVSALLFTSASGQCTTPKVRKEWRCLSPDQRASWINAVKVFVLSA